MITNDRELQVTQERIARFQHWLADLRRTARPEELETMSSGYRLELGKEVRRRARSVAGNAQSSGLFTLRAGGFGPVGGSSLISDAAMLLTACRDYLQSRGVSL